MTIAARTRPQRIVLATTGSLGDLHPYLALAQCLQARGHFAVIATSAYYRKHVEAAGLAFAEMRPNPPLDERAVYAKILDPKTGAAYTFRDLILAVIDDTYADLHKAVIDTKTDLLISSPTVFAARLLHERYGLPWASSVLAPMTMFSAYEPPIVLGIPPALSLGPGFLRPWWGRMVLHLARLTVRGWMKHLKRLRKRLGLAAMKADPIFSEHHAPALALALFSRNLARPQPDWPAQAVQTGFVFFDADAELDARLAAFIEEGPAPLIFTLGSTAVHAGRKFFTESFRAVELLGERAVFIMGNAPENRTGLPQLIPKHVLLCDYAPYAAIFPHASLIVHQGGVGTTAQALRAGVPSLIVPFNFDQPDNAARIVKRGLGATLSRSAYRTQRVAAVIRAMLDDTSLRMRAEHVGRSIMAEHGAERACEAIERILYKLPPPHGVAD